MFSIVTVLNKVCLSLLSGLYLKKNQNLLIFSRTKYQHEQIVLLNCFLLKKRFRLYWYSSVPQYQQLSALTEYSYLQKKFLSVDCTEELGIQNGG